jgi:hypothetical protein
MKRSASILLRYSFMYRVAMNNAEEGWEVRKCGSAGEPCNLTVVGSIHGGFVGEFGD